MKTNFGYLGQLARKPKPYEKGTSSMWTDPYISKQLLQLHIDPTHDMASRSREKIERIVGWIEDKAGRHSLNILDLGCGPGLYAEIFAQKGHSVTGIDFSENSIQYASRQAKEKNLNIRYLQKNYLETDFENQFDLAILIYLDFCVLLPEERDKVLENVYRALKNGGMFIFDIVNGKNISRKILPQSWEVCQSGFWKETPYMVLNNGYHYPETRALANHHVVIGEDGSSESYIFWSLYYEKEDLLPILESKGFTGIAAEENVLPGDDCWNGENITFYTALKKQ